MYNCIYFIDDDNDNDKGIKSSLVKIIFAKLILPK
jgi:hypothetical protein